MAKKNEIGSGLAGRRHFAVNRYDIAFVIIVVIAACAACIINRFAGYNLHDNPMAVITLDGSRYGSYPLSEHRVINIEYEGNHNTIVIDNGAVYIYDADCPDRYCVRQGKIASAGESIICLPHSLVVEIKGTDIKESIDGVSG